MWERQYEHGRWNGHKLHIQSTAIDGGKRLHVSDIPYADLPHIKVMGSKARNIKLDVVFVGASSLAEANAFIATLESTPVGELEHPWLGELSLTFETFSQNINTKRGLVTLSLTFVRSGVSPTITAPTIVRAKEQASAVEKISSESFAREVKEMNIAQINQTQSDFTQALDVLVDITNRLNQNDDTLKSINHAINEAYSAISSLSQRPQEFAELFSTAASSVADGIHAQQPSHSEAVDYARSAQAMLHSQLKQESPSAHYNVQMAVAAVKMNTDLTTLEKSGAFEVTSVSKRSSIMQSDLTALVANLDERIKEVTAVSTLESMALFDELVALRSHLYQQSQKVAAGSEAHHIKPVPRYCPALVIAHDEYTKEALITELNATLHPLFICGDIAVRDAL